MYCKHCGKEIDDDSSHCKYCGKSQGKNNSFFKFPKLPIYGWVIYAIYAIIVLITCKELAVDIHFTYEPDPDSLFGQKIVDFYDVFNTQNFIMYSIIGAIIIPYITDLIYDKIKARKQSNR